MTFDITVPLPSFEKAFQLLASNIRRLDWYLANGRSNRMDYYQGLNHPLIHEMVDHRQESWDEFTKKYQQRFLNEFYNENAYHRAIETVQTALPMVQKCYPAVQQLNKSWGFEIKPSYQIDIDLWGMGGRYDASSQTGRVIIGFGGKSDKNPSSLNSLAYMILHEMIHIGIENLIINPNGLKNPPIHQEEKERLVDNLCIYAAKDKIPFAYTWSDGRTSLYQEVAKNFSYMDKVAGIQPQTDLRQSVRLFLTQKNRRLHMKRSLEK